MIALDELDATRFDRLVELARTSLDPGAAVELLDEALGLWRGPAYAEFADEQFVAAEAARLTELRLGAVEHRAELLLALGRHAELLAPLGRFTAEHPLRERARAALMLAQYRSGRTADALAVFRDLRERLVTELGIEPSPTVQQLHADLLAQRLEPVAAPAPPARNLPAPVTSFVGREADVAAVSAALPKARLLTLTGVGGVGKTRLALAVAAASEASYPDGARLCELAPVAEPDAVPAAVATALGVTQPGGTTEDGVVAALHHRCLLLVLDNCEHLVEAAGRLAYRLIAECPRVTVLATSRQPLAVDGEHRRLVAPLPLPAPDDPGPAVQLFADRAGAVDPPTTTVTRRPRQRRSAAGWTACRWPLSSRRHGWPCSAPRSWPAGSASASVCSARAPGRRGAPPQPRGRRRLVLRAADPRRAQRLRAAIGVRRQLHPPGRRGRVRRRRHRSR